LSLAFFAKLIIFEKHSGVARNSQEGKVEVLGSQDCLRTEVAERRWCMKTILVVEDEKHLQVLYAQELTAEGYNVITVGDGGEAMEKIKNNPIDLAILDIKLENENGLNVLRNIMEYKRGLKVIINTAYSSYRNDFKSWSAEDYIVKSSNLDDLLSKVRQLAPLGANN
jgi:DNA-binding NtrC family response regulator